MFEATIEKLKAELEKLSAVEVSEIFLSPHISQKLFIDATYEPGPTMWIVNRSDISTVVLEHLLKHPITSISERAAEKLKMRKSTITNLAPPEVEEDLSKVEDYGIEDILGHPLCPWEAMLFFAIHTDEDVRASTCLSLTRRLWEHPLQSTDFPLIEAQFKDIFSILASEDLSPMVRAYAARIPFWNEEEVGNFILAEHHPYVIAKWMQNDNCPINVVEEILKKLPEEADDIFLRRVIAADKRLPSSLRKIIAADSKTDIEALLHEANFSLC